MRGNAARGVERTECVFAVRILAIDDARLRRDDGRFSRRDEDTIQAQLDQLNNGLRWNQSGMRHRDD